MGGATDLDLGARDVRPGVLLGGPNERDLEAWVKAVKSARFPAQTGL